MGKTINLLHFHELKEGHWNDPVTFGLEKISFSYILGVSYTYIEPVYPIPI